MTTNQVVMTMDIAGGSGVNIVVTHMLDVVIETEYVEVEVTPIPVVIAHTPRTALTVEVTVPEVVATVEEPS